MNKNNEPFITHGALYAFIVSLVLLFGMGAYALSLYNQRTEDLHNSQVAACQASLKPGGIRYIVAQQILDQIRQSKSFDYSQFFPSVSPDQLKQLIAAQLVRQREEVRQLLNVNCIAQYSKP